MQDQIRIVQVNELKPGPLLIKSLAEIFARAIKDRIASGRYVVEDGIIRKAEKID